MFLLKLVSNLQPESCGRQSTIGLSCFTIAILPKACGLMISKLKDFGLMIEVIKNFYNNLNLSCDMCKSTFSLCLAFCRCFFQSYK